MASLIGSLVGIAALAFVVRIVVREWSEVSDALAAASEVKLAAAVVLSGAGMSWIGFQWSAVLRSLGGPRVATDQLMRSYFLGQLGKYVPGGIWTVVGRAELLTRAAVPRSYAYQSVGLSMVTTYLAALVVTAVAAPYALWRLHLDHGWVVAMAPVGLLVMHPAILGRVVALGERVFSRGQPTVVPAWQRSIILVFRHVPAWLFISASTWLISDAIGAGISPVAIAYATPLSWAAGLVAVPVPGGIGVREAVFVGLLAGSGDPAAIATIAIASRLAFIAADLIAATAAATLIEPPAVAVDRQPVS